MFSGHGRIFTQMDLEQLWICAQDQASPNPCMDGEGIHEVPPLAEKALAVEGCWRQKVSFVPTPGDFPSSTG